jgi:hypothetical protein
MLINNMINDPTLFLSDYGSAKRLIDMFLKNAMVFEITNVSDYVYELASTHPDKQFVLTEDIPNCTPPFKNMWFEWRNPTGQRELHTAVHALVTDNDNGWTIYNDIYFERSDNKVNKDGTLIIDVNKLGRITKLYSNNMGDPQTYGDQMVLTFMKFALYFVGMAISFSHCKNVTLHREVPPEKLQKARVKRKKTPMVAYHILEIAPMTKTLREEGKVDRHGIAKAFHICRGHFKDFSNGAGLYGKHHGLYWWEAHTRGRKERGTVNKTYTISPTKTPKKRGRKPKVEQAD